MIQILQRNRTISETPVTPANEVLNSLPFACYAADIHTNTILYSNYLFCKLWQLENLENALQKGKVTHSELITHLSKQLIPQQTFTLTNQLVFENGRLSAEDELLLSNDRVIRRITSRLASGNPHQFLYTFEDITDRKIQEQALIKGKQDAEESGLAKQQFLSAMSHEIRTPMNAVIGMTHLLMQENPRPDQLDNLKTLKFSSENLLVLINDILDLSKIEAGKMIFEETAFDLKELVYNIKNSLNYKADEKGIRLHIRLDPTLPKLMVGDPVRLSQVLNNLISNAIKFTEKGGVTIDIMLESEDIETLKLNFAIIDTGIGISKDKLDYIFESFTQENTDITRRFGGTGLGLAITKRLLQLQNSQIYVESSVGKGSVFYFTLGFKRSLKEEIETVHEAVDYAGTDLGHVKLLLVEDNEINQIVATKFLKQLNIKPDYASNGKLAIDKASIKAYDIILMDLQMPEMGGYEATRAIRNLGDKNAHIPIIAVTAGVILDTHNRAMAAGITDFTAKPINPNELYQKILKYIRLNGIEVKSTAQKQLPMPEKHPVATLQLNYEGLLEVCAGDQEAQYQMLNLSIHSFRQFKTNYQNALSTKNEAQLESAAHYMKTLFHMLNAKALIDEIEHARKLLANPSSLPQLFEESVLQMSGFCNTIVADLEIMLHKRISA
ncbi:response regulator [Rhodocytophaga rosea]|uniref:histidine kinase n=1 Tax=Rhodocytophaga rosea TaxID=2704465 RepID=A0A6C0GPU6_9BACT|nr:ATP-binding protein [Rhodocytophaga rosea]QHT69864.1 response regulator [Rhodocytophaga rosea]